MTAFAPLISLVVLMAASMLIGAAAHRAETRGGFIKSYFLGNRGLGSWSMALTATVMSGGTFMGFPSLVYKYGWVVALWIASYMMVPLCTFAILGKPIGRIARATGAVTVPELFRERFRSAALGKSASLILVFLFLFGLVAQFKGGAIILQQVIPKSSAVHAFIPQIGDKSPEFVFGLLVFFVVTVSYTVYGGFLAAVWTDVFQSVLMAVGVVILLPLALGAAGGLAAGTQAGIQAAGTSFAYAPGAGREFLPVTLAFSFFAMWSLAGLGQPATLVRLMAYDSTQTLRRATGMLAVYNTLIYLPLVIIFIAARAIVPGLEKSDEIMPVLALKIANPWVSGLILAAPYGAVMATVSGFLVQISSALVQDFYHHLRPNATEAVLARLAKLSIVSTAAVAALATLRSPDLLQALIVFTGGSAAAAFLVPAVMTAFAPRATSTGALAAMWGGLLTNLMLYIPGWLSGNDPGIGEQSKFYPVYILGVAPFVWATLASAVCALIGNRVGTPAGMPELHRASSKQQAL